MPVNQLKNGARLLALSFKGVDTTNMSTASRLKNVISKTVAQIDGNFMVLGVGSWANGKNYNDPLAQNAEYSFLNKKFYSRPSDHDMEIIIPSCLDRRDAMKLWVKFRHKLSKAIKEEFSADGKKALNAVRDSVTVYPPAVLLTQFDNSGMKLPIILNPNIGKNPDDYLKGRIAVAYMREWIDKGCVLIHKSIEETGSVKCISIDNKVTFYKTMSHIGLRETPLDLSSKDYIKIADLFLERANQKLKARKVDYREVSKLISRSNHLIVNKSNYRIPSNPSSELCKAVESLKNAETVLHTIANLPDKHSAEKLVCSCRRIILEAQQVLRRW